MTSQENRLQQMLVTLRTRLLVMCAATGLALDDACRALMEGDVGRASAVIDGDEAINEMENEIDEKALSLLARAQPVAKDLRFVVSALRMVADLERIGDEAASMAERAILMQGLPPQPIMVEVGKLMDHARMLYCDSVTSFREGDKALALVISRSDDEATQMEMRIIHDLIHDMGANMEPHVAMNIILITRALNRVWRRAANIAEHVYFMLDGVSIKHKRLDIPPRS